MADTDQELIDLGSQWAAAMVSNDAGLIGSFMADDWVIVAERGISSKEHFSRLSSRASLRTVCSR